MDNVKNLMMALAEVMPFEAMVDNILEDCQEYKLVPTEDLRKKIIMNSHMICLKEAMDLEGGFENLSKRLKDLKKADDFFNPSLQ